MQHHAQLASQPCMLAIPVTLQGHEYKQQYEEERRKASRRISMRV